MEAPGDGLLLWAVLFGRRHSLLDPDSLKRGDETSRARLWRALKIEDPSKFEFFSPN